VKIGATRGVYRRARGVVCYWRAGQLILCNAATGQQCAAGGDTLRLLHACSTWRSLAAIRQSWDAAAHDAVAQALTSLTDAGMLERRARSPRAGRSTPAAEPASGWDAWNPEAGFFHVTTRNVHAIRANFAASRERVWRTALETKRPPLFKTVSGSTRRVLPPPRRDLAVAGPLLARRTWRRFGPGPLALGDLATLLGLTWGVQAWAVGEGGQRFALRTSPSGGALQPLEVYVLALDVRGLDRGLYHYAPVSHALSLVRRRVPTQRLGEYLGGQWWFESASAICFMSAVFGRTQWKYRFPRAYRTVLTEAGHFCQTFCLVATDLGLAPFCTQAIVESPIEHDLGLDGLQEAVLYAAGVGLRPADGRPGQWPDHADGHPFARPAGARARRR
jgi:SagB-type dehydrogenase family enzyme